MMCFLARWAWRLSWPETARAFHTSWECVYRSIKWHSQRGLTQCILVGIKSIGIDEIHWGQSWGANGILPVIYQIDRHRRRLLSVRPKRTQATSRRGLAALGPEVVGGLRRHSFSCDDNEQAAAEIWEQICCNNIFHIRYLLKAAAAKAAATNGSMSSLCFGDEKLCTIM
jgi:hypothetical protein